MVRPPLLELKAFVKTVLCARSLRTARLLHTQRIGRAEVRLPGFPGSFRLRTGTSDAKFLRVLAERRVMLEYEPPLEIHPRTILDIGANIGAVTAMLVRSYPQARIFAFEPLPENFELLAHNVAQFPNVTPLPYGLGARTEHLTYTHSDNPRNFGGGGVHGGKDDPALCRESVPVLAVPEALEQIAVDRIDLIKIDTEGAEHDILTSFPAAVLKGVGVIVGELHGKPRDPELLDYLEQWFTVQRVSRGGRIRWFKAYRREPQEVPATPAFTVGKQVMSSGRRIAAAGAADDKRHTLSGFLQRARQDSNLRPAD